MKFASIAPLAAALWLSACATGTDSVPTQPPLLASSLAGNPPPPRVLGILSGAFRIVDPATMKVTNVPQANQLLSKEYRKGWEVS